MPVNRDVPGILADLNAIEANTALLITIDADTSSIASDATAILADTASMDINIGTIAGDTTSIDATLAALASTPPNNRYLEQLLGDILEQQKLTNLYLSSIVDDRFTNEDIE